VNVATSVTVTDGNFNSNISNGIELDNLTGPVMVSGGVTVTANINDGLLVNVATSVTVTGGNFQGNIANGIELDNLTGPVMVSGGVTVTGNVKDGLLVNGATGVTVTGGSFSSNVANGIELLNLTGAVLVTGANANNNVGDGLFVNGGTNVTVSGGSFSANGVNGIELKSLSGTVLINGGLTASGNANDGIELNKVGSSPVTISGITASGNTCIGIDLFNSTPPANARASVDGSTITGNSIGIRTNGDLNTVVMVGTGSPNTISNNTGTACSDGGFTGIGIDVDGGCLIGSFNIIEANTVGVQQSGNHAFIQLRCNIISGNTQFGANNVTTVPIDAILNYWGSAGGPNNAGSNPAGDKVSAHVDFAPWYTTSSCVTGPPPQLVFNNTTGLTDLVITGSTAVSNVIIVKTNTPTYYATVNNVTYSFNGALVTGHIVIYALGNMSNYVQVVGPVSAEIHAGNGNDTITGGSGDDVIWGGAGNDVIQGGGGNDVLISGSGGTGRTRMAAGSGHSILIAGTFKKGLTHFNSTTMSYEAYNYNTLHAIAEAWAAGMPDMDLMNNLAHSLVHGLPVRMTGGTGLLTGNPPTYPNANTSTNWFLGQLGSPPGQDIVTNFNPATDKKTSL
jgi:hypothetical protein